MISIENSKREIREVIHKAADRQEETKQVKSDGAEGERLCEKEERKKAKGEKQEKKGYKEHSFENGISYKVRERKKSKRILGKLVICAYRHDPPERR